ncbi:MAG TPA: toll/interleukin-1 receptor domain-containing protein [Hyphomonadaceae bacterium]
MTGDNAQPARIRIFISYASASRERVGRLARALEAEGFEVWWDHAVNPGEDYRAKTEAALAAADSVIVCWSTAACGSDWVLSEADDARKRDRLVPVRLDACAIPKPFDRIYTIDLPRWSLPRFSAAFHRLVEVLRARAENREPAPAPWQARWLSWSNFTIVALGTATLLTNISDIKQLLESFTDPAASRRQVEDLTLKFDEVKNEIVRNRELSPAEQLSLRQSLFHLLSAQDGVRREAAQKAAAGDIDGALDILDRAAREGEKAISDLAEILGDFGALASRDFPYDAIAAYDRALSLAGDPNKSLALAALLLRTGQLPRAEDELNFLLAGPRPNDPLVHVAVLAGLGEVRNARGNYRGAREVLLQALDAIEPLRDDWLRAAILLALGQSAQGLRDSGVAEDYHRQALALFERERDAASQAKALNNLGTLAIDNEQITAAEDYFQRALKQFEALGVDQGRAQVLSNLGVVARRRGDLTASDRFYRAALQLSEKLGDTVGHAQCLSGMALNAIERKQYDLAEQQMTEALGIYETAGARANVAIQLQNLATLALKRNDLDRVGSYGREAAAIYRELGQTREADMMRSNLRSLGLPSD